MDFIGDIYEVLFSIIFNNGKFFKNSSKIVRFIITIISLMFIITMLVGCLLLGIVLIDKNMIYSIFCFIVCLLMLLGLIDGFIKCRKKM